MKKNLNQYINLLPLLLFLLFIFVPIVLFLLHSSVFILFYYCILLYLVYKICIFFIFSLVGFFKYRKAKEIDYLSKIDSKNLPDQLIALAVYKENPHTIIDCLDSIAKQNYPSNKLHVSISFEERQISEFPEYLETIEKIKQFKEKYPIDLSIFLHPENLPNEVPGAASNKTWAVRSYVEKVEEGLIKNYIVTIPDADTVFSKNYLSNIAYKWLNSKNRNRIFIQPAMYKFQNNYRKLRSFTRIISTTLTLSILSTSSYKPQNRYTFSCFSLSLGTLIQADYWLKSIAIDDTPFYWRPYTLFNGDWKCEVIYSEISVNSIYEYSFRKNILAQYSQFYRWGWGILAFPIGVKAITNNQNIFLLKKIKDLLILLENMIVAKTAFISLMICTFLYTYHSPEIAEQIYKVDFLAILIPLTFLLRILVIPSENLYTFIVKLLEDIIFVFPIGIVNLIVFGYLPYLHASIDFAKKKNHYEKISWSEKK